MQGLEKHPESAVPRALSGVHSCLVRVVYWLMNLLEPLGGEWGQANECSEVIHGLYKRFVIMFLADKD